MKKPFSPRVTTSTAMYEQKNAATPGIWVAAAPTSAAQPRSMRMYIVVASPAYLADAKKQAIAAATKSSPTSPRPMVFSVINSSWLDFDGTGPCSPECRDDRSCEKDEASGSCFAKRKASAEADDAPPVFLLLRRWTLRHSLFLTSSPSSYQRLSSFDGGSTLSFRLRAD
jgi:hypothetical protein